MKSSILKIFAITALVIFIDASGMANGDERNHDWERGNGHKRSLSTGGNMTNKRTRLILCLPLLLIVTLCHDALAATTKGKEAQNMDKLTANIHWLGHDSFRIDGEGVVIYIDPYRLKEGPKADLILITHDHSDHASVPDVALIQKQDTVIVTIKAAAQKLSGQIKTVLPGEELAEKGVLIKTLPAYNLNKFRSPGVPFHPKDAGHVGYLITVKGVTIYHTGDTDFIPEMKGLKPDVALLPVSGTYVMTAEEAAEAAAAIQPKVAIPMHVGAGIGSLADAERFREKAAVPVMVLPIEK